MRRPFVLALLSVALLLPAASATAKTMPASPPFRVVVVDSLDMSQFRVLARRGASGLLVPEVGPTVYQGLRRVLLHRFPYSVYYRLLPSLTTIEVRACVHQRRHPRSWRHRA